MAISSSRPHPHPHPLTTNHGRLHKRGNSASSITSPSALSPLSDVEAFSFNRTGTPKVTYEEPWTEPKRPMPSATSSNPLKPYLRKLSSKDHNTVDLSRPAAENEGLAGLGISDYNNNNNNHNTTTTIPYSRSVSDVSFAPMNSRNRHHRSTSNTSQFSNSSSLQRPAAPYMPAIRQTRPYTPPVSNTPPSVTDNGADDIMSDDEFRMKQNAFDPARRSGSISSTPGITSTLRIHTTGSSTRLAGSYSPSSVSLTSPIAQARSRGDTLKSIDTTTSPSARTSIDKAFGFIRPGRDSPVDAASRAASIRAARQAFNEKEQAKELKHDKEAMRQAERESRKQMRKEKQRRDSDARSRPERHGRSTSDDAYNSSTPRPSIGGRQYSDHQHAHSRSLPAHVTYVDQEKQGMGSQPQVTKTRAAKGRWLRFVTWFRTRLLRISKGLNMS